MVSMNSSGSCFQVGWVDMSSKSLVAPSLLPPQALKRWPWVVAGSRLGWWGWIGSAAGSSGVAG